MLTRGGEKVSLIRPQFIVYCVAEHDFVLQLSISTTHITLTGDLFNEKLVFQTHQALVCRVILVSALRREFIFLGPRGLGPANQPSPEAQTLTYRTILARWSGTSCLPAVGKMKHCHQYVISKRSPLPMVTADGGKSETVCSCRCEASRLTFGEV